MTSRSLVVVQTGGPTAVINASLAGVVGAAQASRAFDRVWGLVHGLEGAVRGEVVDLAGLTADRLDRLAATPASALGGSRYKLQPGDDARILATLDRLGASVFVGIGGDGTMQACDWVARQTRGRLAVVGVPKTIDNDLAGTDHCPGYPSAARAIASLTRDTALDLRAMCRYDRVVVMEAMGRNVGWLAASSALARAPGLPAPHLIYTPERAVTLDGIVADVDAVLAREAFAYAVVAEGIRLADGTLIAALRDDVPRDVLGRPIMSLGAGAGQVVAEAVTAALGVQTRPLRLGTVQRASSAHVSPLDRAEARALGEAAVRAALDGATDVMMALRRWAGPYAVDIVPVPFAEVLGHERPLPAAFLAPDRPDVTPAFVEWLTPLLGGPLGEMERLELPARRA